MCVNLWVCKLLTCLPMPSVQQQQWQTLLSTKQSKEPCTDESNSCSCFYWGSLKRNYIYESKNKKTKKIKIIDSIDFLLSNTWQNRHNSMTPCDVMCFWVKHHKPKNILQKSYHQFSIFCLFCGYKNCASPCTPCDSVVKN